MTSAPNLDSKGTKFVNLQQRGRVIPGETLIAPQDIQNAIELSVRGRQEQVFQANKKLMEEGTL